jgi:hypothetical protein
MAHGCTYVEGVDLADLILEVRSEFFARLPYELDDTRRPNSVRLVAIDVFEERSIDEQLAVVRDLIDANPAFTVARPEDRDIFAYADTAADYLTDLVCEVVWQVLGRDPSIREEDVRRVQLSIESSEELNSQ